MYIIHFVHVDGIPCPVKYFLFFPPHVFVENTCSVAIEIYFLIWFALQQEDIYSSDSRVQRQYPQPTFFQSSMSVISLCLISCSTLLFREFVCIYSRTVEQQDSGAALCVHFEKMSVIDLPLFSHIIFISLMRKRGQNFTLKQSIVLHKCYNSIMLLCSNQIYHINFLSKVSFNRICLCNSQGSGAVPSLSFVQYFGK